MEKHISKLSEIVAEQYATVFLNDYLGGELFLGSEIEQILSEKAHVVYQAVDDPTYFGAAIHIVGEHIVAINTKQSLRMRYYSAAHELWHLQFEAGEIPLADFEDFDHERAADRFAAAIMLPAGLMRNLLNNLKENADTQIIKIADLSSMPYVAVTRRMRELGHRLSRSISSRTENEWIDLRQDLNISPSVLDKADAFTQFSDFSNEVNRRVENDQLTLEIAANLLRHIDSDQAEYYWQKRQEIMDEWTLADD